MYKLILLSEAEKAYKRLHYTDRSVFERISNALKLIQVDPYQGKQLKHQLKGKFSMRVGVYRIIYQIEKSIVTVYVVDIGHRKEIYR